MARAESSKKKTEKKRAVKTPKEEPKKDFSVSDRRHWARRQEGEAMEEPTEPGERLPTYVEEITAKLAQKDHTLREYIEAHKETKAEMEAARARLAQDMERRLELHKQEFFAGLLPCLDNLERAVAAGRSHQDSEGLLQGITMVRDLFVKRLKEEGIERVSTAGEDFDPMVHEAMSVVYVDTTEEDNKVIEELSPGYLYKNQLLRAAQVRVGQLAVGSSAEKEKEESNHADL
jgi:molecular chaperone GrpE